MPAPNLAGGIHLYLVPDGEDVPPQLRERYRPFLDAEETARVARYRFERDQLQSLVARALLRTALSLYRPGIAPEDWRFVTNEYGKPSIAGEMRAGLGFNLSHTRGRIVLVVADIDELGVDIEPHDRTIEALALAERFFSASETADLMAVPQEQRQARFFDLWTLKEAYIKARGMGLSLPLSDFSFRFEGEDGVSMTHGPGQTSDAGRWRFWCLGNAPGFKLALAVAEARAPVLRVFEGMPLDQYEERPALIIRSGAGCR